MTCGGRPIPQSFQGQQSAEGMSCWDHGAAWHLAVADNLVEVELDEVGDEQEEPTELGVQAAW